MEKEIKNFENMTQEEIQEWAALELMVLSGKTNTEIIELELLAAGVFNFKYNGENLNTYAKWRKLGYQVRKGEKAYMKCELWTPCKYKKEDQEEKKEKKEGYTKMFLKKSALFTAAQVKPAGEKKTA